MKVLLTGANGYIGRRLMHRLMDDPGINLRILVRHADTIRDDVRPGVIVFTGSTFDSDSLARALDGVDTAYYLVHSLGAGGDFRKLDRESAHNFLDACINAGVKRIIYLGGLGDRNCRSVHLLSRIETGEILSSRPDRIHTIWFRAGIIIGSGGASFEIIHHLVEKLPVMFTPRWVKTLSQPIAVDDVIDYCHRALYLDVRENLAIDIGGEVMSFRDMMKTAARVRGLHRLIIPLPVISPAVSSYFLVLFTPVSWRIASALVKGLRVRTVIRNDLARWLFPDIIPMSCREAFEHAYGEIEERAVLSRWSDHSSGMRYDDERKRKENAVYRDERCVPLGKTSPADLFRAVLAIGGENGWFAFGFLWRIRGHADKIVGGAGLNRGRRLADRLRVGDTIDFWRVIDIEAGRRLVLASEMKLPGRGWLEFEIKEDRLVQTALFHPRGLWGRLYWILLLPFHLPIFILMSKRIVRKAYLYNKN